MIKPEQMPDEAVFAMQDCMKHSDTSPWDWIVAALNAWPGMYPVSYGGDEPPFLVLPLTTENPNAEA